MISKYSGPNGQTEGRNTNWDVERFKLQFAALCLDDADMQPPWTLVRLSIGHQDLFDTLARIGEEYCDETAEIEAWLADKGYAYEILTNRDIRITHVSTMPS